jgi:ketosteroid isomerase-like protein
LQSRIIVFCLFVISATTAFAQAPATTTRKSLRESLLKADRDLSMATLKKGIRAAFTDVLASDGYLLYEGAPVIGGKANVVEVLGSQPVLNTLRVKWLPLVVTTSEDGTLGATWGVTTIASPDDSVGPRFGKYINMWRRASDGTWQLVAHVDMGRTDAKVVLSKEMKAPVFDPRAGNGAAFAKADLDFSKSAGANGAPAAFAEFAATDAMTLPGTGEIVIGPPAIKSRMSESPAAAAKWEWHPVYSEGAASGDLGYTIGEAVITPPGATPDRAFKSKYLTVWRRQPDGSIRYIVDGGNSR